ncbi:NAD(P)-binding protein [Pholiota conissans]|uniref:NAD(P)-binding protein n=1 Tax=Pholiota conissans TaxID=109636 RepID=A0A9P6D431_9AGAR|nr:NAD(P)-binding protein [Pholiota conissans]
MPKVVLVTGASGFLASHIIHQLLLHNYHIRATAREGKLEELRQLYKDHPFVEIIQLDNISNGQFAEGALEGVEAVIHTANPLPGRTSPEEVMKSAIDGSLNVLRQGEKYGVQKFVVTGSSHNFLGDPATKGVSYQADHWNAVTKEEASEDSTKAYAGSKKFAELAVWEWAEQHPHVEVTTTPADFASFSTNLNIYNLLTPTGKYPARPAYVDVRDAARAHVGAIEKPTSSGRRRVILASPHGVVFDDLLKLIKRARPELEGRLITSPAPKFAFDRYDVDFGRIEEITGLRKEDFRTLEESFLETIDALLAVEDSWKKAGYSVESVPSIRLEGRMI